MSLVYFITCHQSVSNIKDLIKFIYREEDIFIFHIDPKAPESLKSYLSFASIQNKNIIIMHSRDYSWAGFSQVMAVMDAVTVALSSTSPWSHFIPISEQHVPTLGPKKIEEALIPETSYVGNDLYNSLPDAARSDIEHRFSAKYIELPGVGSFATRLKTRNRMFYDQLRHGSNWYILSYKACLYLHYCFANESIVDEFKYAIHSDESAIITMLYLTSERAGSIVNSNMCFVAYPHLSKNNDLIFTEENFFSAQREGKLFIRKRPDIIPEKIIKNLQVSAKIPRENPDAINGSSKEVDYRIKMTEMCNRFIERSITSLYPDGRLKIYSNLHSVNIPRFYIKYKSDRMPADLSIVAISENLINFKVLIVTDYTCDKVYMNTIIYDKDAFLLRVRVIDMFLHYELKLNNDSHGFVRAENESELNKLLDELLFHITECEKLSFITSNI